MQCLLAEKGRRERGRQEWREEGRREDKKGGNKEDTCKSYSTVQYSNESAEVTRALLL